MKKKRCTKCKKIKPVSEFYKQKTTKDGYRYYCKKCIKEYREAHKKEIKEYREAHKKEIAAYQKEYREAHKKEVAARLNENIKKIKKGYAIYLIKKQTGLNKNNITQEMIELKRKNIQLKRLLKEV